MQIDLTSAMTSSAETVAPGLPVAAGAGNGSGGVGNMPFANVLQDAVTNMNQLETQASGLVEGLVAGRGVDIHTAMIATQKADLAFEMALAVRGKAVAAYQSLMSVQF